MGSQTETPSGEKKTKISHLNESLEFFKNEVTEKEHAANRVDIAIITFGGGVDIRQEFTGIKDWEPPKLEAGGNTPMGEAIERGIDLIEEIKNSYTSQGIAYTRPLLWLLTDGVPTDMEEGNQKWDIVRQQLEVGEHNHHLIFLPMGVGMADMDLLNSLSPNRPALKIKEGMFREYFEFVSNSLEKVSNPDEISGNIADNELLDRFTQKNKNDRTN
jgi:uncharacterized protein YegL